MINSVGGALPHELFTFGSLLMCSLCVQPVQLEKAISNPDLRAGKVRQRSVASAENTEVAGECAVCTLQRGRGLFIYDNSISYDI